MKKVILGLMSVFLANCSSHTYPEIGFSPQEVGIYGLWDVAGNPMPHQIHLKLIDNQWVADSSEDNGRTWSNTCGKAGICQLRDSTREDIYEMFKSYPPLLRDTQINCIQNVAFAVCRVYNPETERVVYGFLPRITQKVIFLKLHKLY